MHGPHGARRAGGLAALHLGLAALACLPAHSAAETGAPPRFAPLVQEADTGQVLTRPALLPPARYRLLLVPGSGCRSLAPSVDRLAAGLMHAEVFILQKPYLGTAAAPAGDCPVEFVQTDRLGAWLTRARRLTAMALQHSPSALPLVLAGLSEGAELLPGLAAALPQADLLVMVGHAGLDPAEAGAMQAQRQGAGAHWDALMREAAQGASVADRLAEGRHLRYWADLHGWALRQPLLDDPRPLLQAWGGQDALMPQAAYAAFATQARERAGGYCSLRFDTADHELRSPQRDHLQTVWAWLERHAREGRRWPARCALEPQTGAAEDARSDPARRPARETPTSPAH